MRVEWLFSDSRQRKKIRIHLGQWRRPENSCNVDSLTCGSILFNHFVYNLFGGRRILLSGVLLCVVENFWCHRLTEWMSERILSAIFPRCLLSLSAQVCKLQVVFAHTHTHFVHGNYLLLSDWARCVIENGISDADKLIYGLIYLCGLVTFCPPHPEHNDIVHGHLADSSLILARRRFFRLACFGPSLGFSTAHTTSSWIDRKSHYQSCRRAAEPHRNVLHIRIIRFSNWIK